MKKLIIIASCFYFSFVFGYSLEIIEIMYNPEGNDSGREWIEVKNISNQVINITSGRSGWRLNDGSNHLFEEDLSVNPGEIFVILQDRNLFLKDYPNFSGKSILANFSLKNESGQVQIFDQNKLLLSSVFYQNSCGGDGNNFSIVFINNQCYENKVKKGTPGLSDELSSVNNSYNNQQNQNLQVTTSTIVDNSRASENIVSNSMMITNNALNNTLINTSASEKNFFQQSVNENVNEKLNLTTSTVEIKEIKTTLIISEFFPNPDGNDDGQEFVEIYNYGEDEIYLENFILEIGSKKIKLTGKIEPKEYWLLTNQDSNFYIRNKGEVLRLYYGKNKIFEISYQGKAVEGKSYSRNDKGEWFFTEPTPGKENIFLNVADKQNDFFYLKSKDENDNFKKYNFNQNFFTTSNLDSFNESKSVFKYIVLSLILILFLTFIVWLKL